MVFVAASLLRLFTTRGSESAMDVKKKFYHEVKTARFVMGVMQSNMLEALLFLALYLKIEVNFHSAKSVSKWLLCYMMHPVALWC